MGQAGNVTHEGSKHRREHNIQMDLKYAGYGRELN
jgi:hypothetical protein